MFRVKEVYEKQVKTFQERPDGTEVPTFSKVFDTRDSLINMKYVVSVHPHEFSSSSDLSKVESAFPAGTKFSTLVVDGNSFRRSELIVVGSFNKFCRLLQENTQ